VRETLQLICATSYGAAVALLAYDRQFVTLWVGPQHYAGDSMVLAFGLAMPLLGMNVFYCWVLNATGHRGKLVPGAAAFALTLLVSCFVLGRNLGPVGIAWAIVLANTATWLWYCPCVVHGTLGIPLDGLVAPYLKTTMLALPVGAACWWWAHLQSAGGWLATGISMAGAGLLYLAACWGLVLNGSDRTGWVQRAAVLWSRYADVRA
jgi:O-antigen/teichoic acid export membrane protein